MAEAVACLKRPDQGDEDEGGEDDSAAAHGCRGEGFREEASLDGGWTAKFRWVSFLPALRGCGRWLRRFRCGGCRSARGRVGFPSGRRGCRCRSAGRGR